jgi:predicted nucleotidyltransferase component of viral defense system
MDMDITIKGKPLIKDNVELMFKEVISINVDDDIVFELDTSEIREGNDYTGYRLSLKAKLSQMSVPLKIDITTGDKITPKEIAFNYKTLFDNKSIAILSYNLETILAEKLETIFSRGDQSTRPRDYYDVYI